jgi:hypothetical protein
MVTTKAATLCPYSTVVYTYRPLYPTTNKYKHGNEINQTDIFTLNTGHSNMMRAK